jgi:hypothetical protein
MASPTVNTIISGAYDSLSPTVTRIEVFGLGADDPTSPDTLKTDSQTNPTLSVLDPATYTPTLSAIFRDPNVGDIANKYQIQVSTDATFTYVTHWDSGAAGTVMADTTEGTRCPEITYAGSALSILTTFYVRFRFWDDDGNIGNWSTENAYFILERSGVGTEIILLGNVILYGNTDLM